MMSVKIKEAFSSDSSVETKCKTKMECIVDVANATPEYDLKKFKCGKILQNNTSRKMIAMLGSFPNTSPTNQAIVLLEKQAFHEKDVNKGTEDDDAGKSHPCYFSDKLSVREDFLNNIYGSFQCSYNGELNAIKATVVYPATPKHIEKYCISQKWLIIETPECYKNITLPFINASQFSLEWVYNILEHKKETDRIVYEDPDPETGFILVPDLKWNGTNVDGLYLLAIAHKHQLKSLRDLTAEHLPLLRNVQSGCARVVAEKYRIERAQLRMYFHYQPSFYHLHVHVNQLRTDVPGIWCEKSHLLDTVIGNLELLPDYYQMAKLPFVLHDGMKLLDAYKEDITQRKRLRRDTTADGDEDCPPDSGGSGETLPRT